MTHPYHETKLGQIRRRHGRTLVSTLRKHYGGKFGAGCEDKDELRDVLQKLDEPTLHKLVRDYEGGVLERVCRR